jgi:hypothetical protein
VLHPQHKAMRQRDGRRQLLVVPVAVLQKQHLSPAQQGASLPAVSYCRHREKEPLCRTGSGTKSLSAAQSCLQFQTSGPQKIGPLCGRQSVSAAQSCLQFQTSGCGKRSLSLCILPAVLYCRPSEDRASLRETEPLCCPQWPAVTH